jgi:hypothetical protein
MRKEIEKIFDEGLEKYKNALKKLLVTELEKKYLTIGDRYTQGIDDAIKIVKRILS